MKKASYKPIGSTLTSVRESTLDEVPAAEQPESGDIPSGWYNAVGPVWSEDVDHTIYKQARRYDFDIASGEYEGRTVSCTIDMAEHGPVYAPRNLMSALKALSKPVGSGEVEECRIYVYRTPIGTNRVDAIQCATES